MWSSRAPHFLLTCLSSGRDRLAHRCRAIMSKLEQLASLLCRIALVREVRRRSPAHHGSWKRTRRLLALLAPRHHSYLRAGEARRLRHSLMNSTEPVKFVALPHDLILVQRPALLHSLPNFHWCLQSRPPCLLRLALVLQASTKLKLLGGLGALLLLLTLQFRQTLLQLTNREIVVPFHGRDRGHNPRRPCS